jgi:hypothetical protein
LVADSNGKHQACHPALLLGNSLGDLDEVKRITRHPSRFSTDYDLLALAPVAVQNFSIGMAADLLSS